MKQEQKENLYSCNICKDTSWIISKDGKATRCKCFELDTIKEQWKSSGFKIDDMDKTFKNFIHWNNEVKNMKSTATNYFLNFEKIKDTKYNSILLCGQSGSGKTHLSIALANNLLKKGYKVVYMQYREVVTAIKQNIIDKDYYKNIISKYQRADILLIDDLFKGKITESDINIIFEIMNYRYINKKPIIASTEFSIAKLLNCDEAVGSRIYEMAKDYTHEIRGQENNYRLKV
jgi:DNA replication protein DnaC